LSAAHAAALFREDVPASVLPSGVRQEVNEFVQVQLAQHPLSIVLCRALLLGAGPKDVTRFTGLRNKFRAQHAKHAEAIAAAAGRGGKRTGGSSGGAAPVEGSSMSKAIETLVVLAMNRLDGPQDTPDTRNLLIVLSLLSPSMVPVSILLGLDSGEDRSAPTPVTPLPLKLLHTLRMENRDNRLFQAVVSLRWHGLTTFEHDRMATSCQRMIQAAVRANATPTELKAIVQDLMILFGHAFDRPAGRLSATVRETQRALMPSVQVPPPEPKLDRPEGRKEGEEAFIVFMACLVCACGFFFGSELCFCSFLFKAFADCICSLPGVPGLQAEREKLLRFMSTFRQQRPAAPWCTLQAEPDRLYAMLPTFAAMSAALLGLGDSDMRPRPACAQLSVLTAISATSSSSSISTTGKPGGNASPASSARCKWTTKKKERKKKKG
jgi:hypothetical protein